MRTDQAAFNLLVVNPFGWLADWAWALPLIVLTMVVHIIGLGFVSQGALRVSGRIAGHHVMTVLAVVMGATASLATCLHGIEAGIWALAYLQLGLFPDFGSAMLYSLNALTSFGHTELSLKDNWRLMGALESLNGWLLFGLTTSFLFAVIQKFWLAANRTGDH